VKHEEPCQGRRASDFPRMARKGADLGGAWDRMGGREPIMAASLGGGSGDFRPTEADRFVVGGGWRRVYAGKGIDQGDHPWLVASAVGLNPGESDPPSRNASAVPEAMADGSEGKAKSDQIQVNPAKSDLSGCRRRMSGVSGSGATFRKNSNDLIENVLFHRGFGKSLAVWTAVGGGEGRKPCRSENVPAQPVHGKGEGDQIRVNPSKSDQIQPRVAGRGGRQDERGRRAGFGAEVLGEVWRPRGLFGWGGSGRCVGESGQIQLNPTKSNQRKRLHLPAAGAGIWADPTKSHQIQVNPTRSGRDRTGRCSWWGGGGRFGRRGADVSDRRPCRLALMGVRVVVRGVDGIFEFFEIKRAA